MIINQRQRIMLGAWLLLALLALLSAAPAAGQSVPRFVDTSEYKNLKSNVVMLQGQATVPTSPEKISEYRQGLSSRVAAANQRLEALFQQRKENISKTISRQRKKTVKQARKKEGQRLARTNKNRSAQLNKISASYRKTMAQISKKYDRRINSLQRTITKLKKDRRQTRNPRKLAIINDRIKESQVLIQNLRQDSQAAVNKARKVRQRAARKVNKKFNKRQSEIKRAADKQVKKIINDYRQQREEKMQANRERRTSNQQTVNSLNVAGTTAIDSMPLAS